MKLLKTISILTFLGVCFLYSSAAGFTSLSDCLVAQNIGIFKFDPKTANMGNASGIVGLTGHFQDHVDQICTGDYSNIDEVRGLPDEEAYEKIFTVEVQVTQHTGSDSDKWLLHEVEDIFRSNRKLGELISGTEIRIVNGNRIFNWVSYAWISGNIVVYINWTPKPDIQNPEPLEIVQAYLQKFPSTIPTMSIDNTHSEKWIKDEMDRRLWLCDKWDAQYQLGKVQQNDLLRELVDHMTVFLDYREKYYGMKALDEKNALRGYLDTKDENSIKNKLTDYKTWWSANKNNAIILP